MRPPHCDSPSSQDPPSHGVRLPASSDGEPTPDLVGDGDHIARGLAQIIPEEECPIANHRLAPRDMHVRPSQCSCVLPAMDRPQPTELSPTQVAVDDSEEVHVAAI